MTAEWYDLAQRLYADKTRRPVPRLAHSAIPAINNPIAVRATVENGIPVVTAALPGQASITARGGDALPMLHRVGVQITHKTWHTLLTDDPATLPTLVKLAHHSDPNGQYAETAAHIAWWADRADFPGGTAVVALVDACRTQWVTGETPDAETQRGTWQRWLGIQDESCAAMFPMLDQLTRLPPLPLLTSLAEDDTWAWDRAQSDHADGWDWRRTDSTARAATGLRARCDAADLFNAALLSDPLYRRRAVHTGHVVTGIATADPNRKSRLTVICIRMDARMRSGTSIQGWTGNPGDTPATRFHGTVAETGMHGGQLTLSLSGVTLNRPAPGNPVTLRPAEPNPRTQRSARNRYRRLYAGRRSWLTTGRTPTPTRRDVPLEVLIAGADEAAP